MAKVRVKLRLDSLRELTYGDAMSSMLWRKGQAVLSTARSRAPVVTGNYQRSFRIRFADTDRNVVRVYNDAFYAVAVEYGGIRRGKARPLGNALDAAGGA